MKLAVLLPGIGYTCDKPLLYYSGKLARALGWEILPVPYGGFPAKVRGDRARLRQSMDIALAQTEELLRDIDWSACEQIVFFSKSIGTAAATAYAAAHGLPCRHVLFTPLAETFAHPVRDAVAFHGTADPWAETAEIRRLCEASRIPLFLTENANHSLETGDVALDIRHLEAVIRQVQAYLADPDAKETRPC
ncbi:MAG: alpha/beta hydrolase [Clostridia bacterium]|nr:alpha/beta hydrolase [Clostridia bacterium]